MKYKNIMVQKLCYLCFMLVKFAHCQYNRFFNTLLFIYSNGNLFKYIVKICYYIYILRWNILFNLIYVELFNFQMNQLIQFGHNSVLPSVY